jgi:Fe-S-cluster-containing dehydrogenase component
MQPAIFIDREKCVGCYACVVACKLEHHLSPRPVRPPNGDPKGPGLIRVVRVGPQISNDEVHQYFQPILCLHCHEAPCIEACPDSAIYRDIETGIILVKEDECTGCESCLEVCPYEAPQFYDGKLHLCDLCIHRLEERRREGRHTACEAACQARAIHVRIIDETSV